MNLAGAIKAVGTLGTLGTPRESWAKVFPYMWEQVGTHIYFSIFHPAFRRFGINPSWGLK